jgi:hypothetical protein
MRWRSIALLLQAPWCELENVGFCAGRGNSRKLKKCLQIPGEPYLRRHLPADAGDTEPTGGCQRLRRASSQCYAPGLMRAPCDAGQRKSSHRRDGRQRRRPQGAVGP